MLNSMARAKKGVKKRVKKPARPPGTRAADPYHAMLNFVQTQAHSSQVDALVKEINQAHSYAKRVRQDTIDEIYAPVRPMDVEERPRHRHPPMPPSQPRDTPMHTSNPFGANSAFARNLEIQRLGAAMQNSRQSARERSRHVDMDVVAHSAEPAVADLIYRFQSQGPATKREKMDHFFVRRQFMIHKDNHNRPTNAFNNGIPPGYVSYSDEVDSHFLNPRRVRDDYPDRENERRTTLQSTFSGSLRDLNMT